MGKSKKAKSMKDVTVADEPDEVDQFHREKELKADKLSLNSKQGRSKEIYSESEEDNAGPEADPDAMMESSEEDEERFSLVGQEGYDDGEGDEDESADEGDQDNKGWGTKKKTYYGADTHDFELDSDMEAAEQEEAEGKRMQKQNFAFQDEEDYEGLGVLKAIVPKKAGKKDSRSTVAGDDQEFDFESGHYVQTVKRNLAQLSKRERLDIVTSEAPELLGLFEDLNLRLKELNGTVASASATSSQPIPELKKIESFFQMRRTLLLTYCTDISFYLMIRAEGKVSVKTHPVIRQIVDLRKILEQSDSMVQSMTRQYQSRLSESAALNEPREESEDDEEDAEERIDGDFEDSEQSDDNIAEEKIERKSSTRVTAATKAGIAAKQLAANGDEEELMRNITAALEGGEGSARKRAKLVSKGLQDLSDFGELETASKLDSKHKTRKIEKKNHSDGEEDEDLFGDMPEGMAEALAQYENASKKASTKKAARMADHPNPQFSYLPENPDRAPEELNGKRKVGQAIIKNRGLTRSRPKDQKNPRVKHREKYRKALVKRRSQVQDYKGKTDNYGGEKSGIKTNLIKSTSIKG